MAKASFTVELTECEREVCLELIQNRVEFLMNKCDVELPLRELASLIETKAKLESAMKSYF